MKVIKIISAGNGLYYPHIPKSFDEISDSLYILARFLTTEVGCIDEHGLEGLYEDIFVYRKMSYHIVSFVHMRGKLFMNMSVPLQLKDFVTTQQDLWRIIVAWKKLVQQELNAIYLVEENDGSMQFYIEAPHNNVQHTVCLDVEKKIYVNL